jgi:prevent-host-death family protein
MRSIGVNITKSKTITVTECRRQWSEVFHEIEQEGTTFILTKYGKPIVVMVPYSRYQKILT